MRVWALLVLLALPTAAQDFPKRPNGLTEFVVDDARLMGPADDVNELHNGRRIL